MTQIELCLSCFLNLTQILGFFITTALRNYGFDLSYFENFGHFMIIKKKGKKRRSLISSEVKGYFLLSSFVCYPVACALIEHLVGLPSLFCLFAFIATFHLFIRTSTCRSQFLSNADVSLTSDVEFGAVQNSRVEFQIVTLTIQGLYNSRFVLKSTNATKQV